MENKLHNTKKISDEIVIKPVCLLMSYLYTGYMELGSSSTTERGSISFRDSDLGFGELYICLSNSASVKKV